MQTEVAIIGAGPAGMAAALQLKRSAIKFLLFEKNSFGGLLKNAWRVENYLGFTEAKSGLELLKSFQQHLAQYAIKPIAEEIKNVDYDKEFSIKTDKSVYYAKYLVVASGTKPKQDSLLAKVPVLYEAYPLLKKTNKVIAIIGAGDAAFDYALNLAKQNKVFVINRGHNIKALPLLINKVMQHPHIIYKENYSLQQVLTGANKNIVLCGLTPGARNKDDKNSGFPASAGNDGKRLRIEADYLIAAIGREPQKEFYTENLLKHEKNLIVKGVLYLSGDVQGQIYRQVSIAVASGIKTAMQIRNLKL